MKEEDCEEVTIFEYLGRDAHEFVTLVIIKCWEQPIVMIRKESVEKMQLDP